MAGFRLPVAYQIPVVTEDLAIQLADMRSLTVELTPPHPGFLPSQAYLIAIRGLSIRWQSRSIRSCNGHWYTFSKWMLYREMIPDVPIVVFISVPLYGSGLRWSPGCRLQALTCVRLGVPVWPVMLWTRDQFHVHLLK